MVVFLNILILRDIDAVHAKFIWGGEYYTLYLIDHIKAFTLDHLLLWQKDTNNSDEHDADIIKWINTLIVSTSTYARNIRVN